MEGVTSDPPKQNGETPEQTSDEKTAAGKRPATKTSASKDVKAALLLA